MFVSISADLCAMDVVTQTFDLVEKEQTEPISKCIPQYRE